jgi:2,4-dienoyl-CoA reductase-like NADH-dependent reductase (Old Yellow Enzyme family)
VGIYDRLFEPVHIGPVTIPNRIVRSAHGTGLHGEALIAYHEARARGGVGMSTIEATSVHPSAPGRLALWSDSCLPFLEELSGRIRPTGMKLLLQLYHPGAGYAEAAGMPEHWSASAIPNPMAGVVPVAMTQAMIDDVVAHFAAAARRCRDAGLDGVDIHASSGYLIHEFLSPALNKRTDRYGGSFENRLRFLREVIAAVRAAVRDSDFAVGVRLPNEDYVPGGIDAAESARIAAAVDADVDYVSLHMGAYWRFHKLIAPADDPLGVEMAANAVITPELEKPVMVVGRIMTLDHAAHIVESGAADMVSMVRALIADPDLVNKARRREERRIRPCIGTNQGCVGQLMTKGQMGCAVNADAAREHEVAEREGRAAVPKRILVAGGGPAGLEFARTAALRGHRVEVHEATGRLGGQAAIAASAPHRHDVGAIVHWLADELETLQVAVHLNSPVDAALVERERPDAVVVATGSMPRSDGLQLSTPAHPVAGFDRPHVHASWTLFGIGRPPALVGPAVVYDDTGTFEAISAADVLLQAGLEVTLVSRFEVLGGAMAYPPVTVGAARERLYASSNFRFVGGHYLRGIGATEVEVGVLFTERSVTIPARLVIFVGFNEPNRELADALAGSGIPCFQIGDVRGRNSIMNAMHAGAALGRTL